jgi:alcohol dehydrogenase class IV
MACEVPVYLEIIASEGAREIADMQTLESSTALPLRPLALHLPRQLAFGGDGRAACAAWVARIDPASVLIVTSPPLAALCQPLVAALREQGRRVLVWDGVMQEPRVEELERAMQAVRDSQAAAIIGIGGGSVMDVAKLAAALCDGRQGIGDVFGIGLLANRALPLACLPTTAGTGSEVSPIAIVQDPADGQKKAVISPHLVPDAAFVDPALTVGAPREVTAASGIDALTHCIEAYANRQAHPLTDGCALEGIRRIGRSLARACEQGDDLVARADVAFGSLCGGLCLGPVNTAAVHALAYPLGSDHGVAHGASNAVLLAHVLEFNLPAMPARYADIARALGVEEGGGDLELAGRGVAAIRTLIERCALPTGIAQLGVPESALPRMVDAAMKVQRLLLQNPRPVTADDAHEIYRRAF